MPDSIYAPREAFLRFCDSCDEKRFDLELADTQYFRIQQNRLGEAVARAKCHKFRKLLGAMRTAYIRSLACAPVVIMEGDRFVCRLNGTHRISVLQYLGRQACLCVVLSPQEYAEAGLSFLSRRAVQDGMAALGQWYQAVELLPSLRTHPDNPQKEGTLIPMLGSLAGQHVIDVGCNSGRYTLEASLAGAALAVGIDKRPNAIEQAQAVSGLWQITKPGLGHVRFKTGNILDDLSSLGRYEAAILACVLYHLGDGLEHFMQALAGSTVRLVIVQGNKGRARKSMPQEIAGVERDGVGPDTPARLVFNLPQFDSLFVKHGFRPERQVDTKWPVVVYRR